MEAPQMRGVEEPLLPERCAVEGGATQSEGAIETQERRYPRLHKRAGLRGLDVWAEISNSRTPSFAPFASIASQRGDRRSKKAACQGLSIGDGMKRERSLW